MVQIGMDLRKKLKKPLGELLPFAEALGRCRGKKVIAVGDEIVFNFLMEGKFPFVSIFDGKTLRKPIEPGVRKKIAEIYPHPEKVENPAGNISKEMFEIARKFLREGGALYVDGEEDLFALPFALLLKEEVLVYGQPGEGCVFLEKGNFETYELEEKIKEMGLMLPHRTK